MFLLSSQSKLMIELQQKLLGDKLRNQAFYEALRKVIKKGKTTVADIGSGTGFLSFLALRLGAKECWLYEYEKVIKVSEQIAKLNHCKNCNFIQKHSTVVKNPPRVDLVISETLGNYALEENIIENIEDAKRFLKPGGAIMPCRIEQYIAPVVTPGILDEINVWDKVGFKLNMTPAKEVALNNVYVHYTPASDLLDKGKSALKWDTIDFSQKNESIRHRKVEWLINSNSSVYGFSVWWKAWLTDDVCLSTSPLDAPTHWEQIFLPLTKILTVKKDQTVSVVLDSDSRYKVGINLKWTTSLIEKGKTIEQIKMDMRKGAY